MTPCEKLGYKVGDRFEINGSEAFEDGSIVELFKDNGSGFPLFKLIEGYTRYTCADDPKVADADLEYVTKISGKNELKPFYIKTENLTEEKLAEIIDKAVAAGASKCECFNGYHDADSFKCIAYGDFKFIGVSGQANTVFYNYACHYGEQAVEITIDQLDEHLGLAKGKKHKHYDLIVKWAANPDGYSLLTKNLDGSWVKRNSLLCNTISDCKIVANKYLDMALGHLNKGKEVERYIDGECIAEENPSFDVGEEYRVKPDFKYEWCLAWRSDSDNCFLFSKRFNSYEDAIESAKEFDAVKVEIRRVEVKYR